MKSRAEIGWRALAALLATGLLLAVPLAFYRGFVEQFSSTKIFLTKMFVVSGLLGWALGLIWGKGTWPPRLRLGPPLALLTSAVLFSCWNSPVPAFSLVEAESFLCGPLWLLLLLSWGGGTRTVQSVAKLVAAAAAAVAVIALLQWTGHDPLLFGGYRVEWGPMVARMRLYSTFGNPNFVAGYLIGAIFLALALTAASTRLCVKAAWFASVVTMFVAIVGTRSRGAWAGLLAGLVIARFVWRRKARLADANGQAAARQAGIASLRFIAASAMVAGIASTVGGLAEVWLTRFAGRVYLWRVSWPMFAEHPLLGSGWGTFQLRFLDLQARFLGEHPDLIRYWSNIRQLHNDPLQLLLEAGLVGFAGLVWLLVSYSREVGQTLGADPSGSTRLWLGASVGGVTAILVDSLFNFQFSIPPTFLLLFTLLGLPTLLSNKWQAQRVWSTVGSVGARKQIRLEVRRLAASFIVLMCVGIALSQIVRRASAERDYAQGLRYERSGEVDRAEQAYRHGLRRNPLSGRLHFGLARVLYLQNRFPDALAEAQHADRTYADSHLEVLKARIQDQMGRAAAALATYRHALALDPTLETVHADIDRLTQ